MQKMKSQKPILILVADDDADDRILIADAFEEAGPECQLVFVEDGVELLEYLNHEGKFSHFNEGHWPGLILLDLNMPRMDGRTALKEIRDNEKTRRIPIVVLTTSESERDILETYNLGVNSYITKPVGYQSLCEMVSVLCNYWVNTVEIPGNN